MNKTAIPSLSELSRVFARIGCLSFGGPAGQIAMLHSEVVDAKGWINERTFLEALNFCHLLPGPEAQQLATWIGWKLQGVRGGLIAGGLFILPGALVMFGLSLAYGHFTERAWFAGLFLGIKAAVLSIVVQALLRMARRALDARWKWYLAMASFVGLFALDAPFPLVIAVAGMVGAVSGRRSLSEPAAVPPDYGRAWRQSLAAVVAFGALWALPMALVAGSLGTDHRLFEIGTYFSKLAVVTFGGAYAVLGYMAQAAVSDLQWLTLGAMVDGLGLAETTPGPLILVTQFVGYLAAANAPAPFTPFVAALLGALLTSWVTFVPCFLWIFAFAPWVDQLRNAPFLRSALSAITAAVVGVIANLTLWFALHVLFRTVTWLDAGPVHVQWPQITSIDPLALTLTVLGVALTFRFDWSILRLLPIMALTGLGASLWL